MRISPQLVLLLFATVLTFPGCDPGYDELTGRESDFRSDTIRGRVVHLGAGIHNACAATAEGGLYCWGMGYFGQLGHGRLEVAYGPVRVTPTTLFSSSSGGYYHTCALDIQGRAWCWGEQYSQALGHAHSDTFVCGGPCSSVASVPYPVDTPLEFSRLRAGGSDLAPVTCGLVPSGSAWCWGRLALGNGTTGSSARPVPVAGGHVFVDLALGGSHVCAIDQGGMAWCWGSNAKGELGSSADASEECGFPLGAECALVPVPVDAEAEFASVTAGLGYTCALSTEGMAWCWGDGSRGQTGRGELQASSVPAPLTGDHRFTSISAGASHGCGLTIEGEAWCWGNGNVGMLGTRDGLIECAMHSNLCSPVPVRVSGGIRFEHIAVGSGFACGVGLDGRIRCWGYNHFGELGIGPVQGPQFTPVPILGQE